jgi:capsular polysaccharide biosynthesis protein
VNYDVMGEAREPELRSYSGFLRRQWWVITLGALLGLLLALVALAKVPKQYTAAAQVLVASTGIDVTNSTSGRTSGDVNLDTEAQIVKSTTIATGAQQLLHSSTSPTDLALQVTVTVPPNTTILSIACTDSTPTDAQQCAHAFAKTYLDQRQATAVASQTADVKSLDAAIATVQQAYDALSAKIQNLPANSAERLSGERQLQTYTVTLNQLSTREWTSKTTQILAGTITSDAELPTGPSSPDKVIFLGAGLVIGLLLGLGVALLRTRADRRVRDADMLERETGLEVLADLPDAHASRNAHTQAVVQLRNAVSAAINPDHRVLLVAAASDGRGAGVVASRLAEALARSGSDVILIHTDPDGYDGPERPGVADALVEGGPATALLVASDQVGGLRILGPGRDPERTGPLLQTGAVRFMVAELLADADYVVMSAPSTSESADAQTLARLAHAALLVVQRARTTTDDVDVALHQFHQVGTTVLGAVLVPKKLDGASVASAGGTRQAGRRQTGGTAVPDQPGGAGTGTILPDGQRATKR